MSVNIADVIVPEVFAPYVIAASTEKTALFESGLVMADDRVSLGTRQGGETVKLPFWNDIDGEAEELSDLVSLTPGGITAGQDVAVLQAMGKAFSVKDLAATLSGDDPAAVIGDRVGAFWTRNMQKRIVSSLSGIFGAASMSGNLLDISGLADGAAVIDKFSFADAMFLLGDASDLLTAVAMHSATRKKLHKDDLLDTIKGADGKEFDMYQGKRVIVDDGLPVPAAGVYMTFLFGQGAFVYAEGQPEVPVETDRDSLGGANVLVSRRHLILHPRGVKWTGAAISDGDDQGGRPTRTDLATGANWTRVYDPKQIRIAAIKHKLA